MPALTAGSFAPDLVDKTLQQAGLAVSSRSLAHTLFALAVSCVLVWIGWGKRAMSGWAAGYFIHLLCDVGGNVPWFYPFAAYQFRPSERTLLQKLREGRPGLAELFLMGWAAVILVGQMRRGKAGSDHF